jgi:replication factor C subunit 3/5
MEQRFHTRLLTRKCSASPKQEIVGDVMKEQTPKQLYVVRGKMYELLVNCIPAEVILRRLAVELLRKLDDELRHKV